MDFDILGAVNARLSRTREAFHEALIVELEALALCGRSPDRKPAEMAHERVLQTAAEYDAAVDAFSNFKVKPLCRRG